MRALVIALGLLCAGCADRTGIPANEAAAEDASESASPAAQTQTQTHTETDPASEIAEVTAAAEAGVAPAPTAVTDLSAPDRIGDLVAGAPFDPSSDPRWVDEGQHPETECGHFSGGSLPAGVMMMVAGGRVDRFELQSADAALVGPFGLYTSMAKDAAIAAMPAGTHSQPHEYGDAGDVYLTWQDEVRNVGVRAEVVGGAVEAVFWGNAEAVTLVEGCS